MKAKRERTAGQKMGLNPRRFICGKGEWNVSGRIGPFSFIMQDDLTTGWDFYTFPHGHPDCHQRPREAAQAIEARTQTKTQISDGPMVRANVFLFLAVAARRCSSTSQNGGGDV